MNLLVSQQVRREEEARRCFEKRDIRINSPRWVAMHKLCDGSDVFDCQQPPSDKYSLLIADFADFSRKVIHYLLLK